MNESLRPRLEDRYDIQQMAAFMRQPEIYWPATDALAPQPEAMNFEEHLLHSDVWTVSCQMGPYIVGYVQFIRRTSVGAEIHVGFRPEARGALAKAFIQQAIAKAFLERGLLKLWAIIPVDNKPARRLAGLIGFRQEGLLTQSIVRKDGLTDLLIMSLSKGLVDS